MIDAKDLTGRRFGLLTVEGRQGALWRCRCDCGSAKAVSGWALRTRQYRRCGNGCPLGAALTALRLRRQGLTWRRIGIHLGYDEDAAAPTAHKNARLYRQRHPDWPARVAAAERRLATP